MENALLTLLKWCLLALVYLFFFRVLQATWYGSTTNVAVRRVGGDGSGGGRRAEKRQAKQAVASAPARALELIVLEPPNEAGRQFQVTGEMTIGRAAGCQITLDDTYISQLHARISPGGGGMAVEDLGSTNGTYVNRQRVTAPTIAYPGDRVQFGGVVMELR